MGQQLRMRQKRYRRERWIARKKKAANAGKKQKPAAAAAAPESQAKPA